jgi:sulfoxide reductase catalytic subunit YedY
VRKGNREPSEQSGYLSRRQFLAAGAVVAGGAMLPAACRGGGRTEGPTVATGFCDGAAAKTTQDELGDPLTPCEEITSYNNFYEFSAGKEGIGQIAAGFPTSPWSVTVSGLVESPLVLPVEEITARFQQEERVYSERCVEGWSKVVPWFGFRLSELLNVVRPLPQARFVRSEAVYDPEHMPGQRGGLLDFPYVGGLRLDEAMHELTFLATGMFGKPLPIQSGAPLRLVVPWKYGFKSIQSIVKIELLEEIPATTWPTYSPREYGFHANVNPDVDHPRWSQASERRLGVSGFRPTLLFNGYEDRVAEIYEGMDLRSNF